MDLQPVFALLVDRRINTQMARKLAEIKPAHKVNYERKINCMMASMLSIYLNSSRLSFLFCPRSLEFAL